MDWSKAVRRAIEMQALTGDELLDALAFGAENDEERDVIECSQSATSAFIDLPNVPLVSLVDFEWTGGMCGSAAGIELLDGGDCGLLLMWDDDSEERLRVVAHIPSRPNAAAITAALHQVDPTLVVSPYASEPDAVTIHEPTLRFAARAWLDTKKRDRGGFTTLGVPLFFVLLYAVTLAAGLPVALLASPAIFGLALAICPPPRVVRETGRRAHRKARTEPPHPRAFDPTSAPIFDPKRGGIVWHGRLFMPDSTRPGVFLQARRPPARVLVLPLREELHKSPTSAARVVDAA